VLHINHIYSQTLYKNKQLNSKQSTTELLRRSHSQ